MATTNDTKLEVTALLAEARVLRELTHELTRELTRELTVPRTNGHGVDLRKVTPDQLLDAWQALRGAKAEAFLLGRIYRWRAARRISTVR
jgi:hypothetical protein